MRYLFAAMIVGVLAVMPGAAQGAIVLPGIENSVNMQMSPSYPAPGDVVHLTLQSPVLDLGGAHITWYKNGKAVPEAADTVDMSFTAGALGSQTAIEADIQTITNNTASVSATIAPTQLDVLYDSDAYVPPFYRGRALPTAGSTLRLQATAQFKKSGAMVPDSQITYTWKQNGGVLAALSGRGRSTATIPLSALDSSETISVRAQTDDGAFVNEQSLRIPLVRPQLLLYVDHPLFGIMFNQALLAQNTLLDKDITIAAIPFFAPIGGANGTGLSYDWTVNGAPVVSTSTTHNEIELNTAGENSIARVELALTSATNAFFDLSNAWNLLLGSSRYPQGSAGSSDTTVRKTGFVSSE